MKGRVWIGSILDERMVFVIDLESMYIIIFLWVNSCVFMIFIKIIFLKLIY
jgi:hypothetical protein